jgi:uncharacterized protein YndB with AHSA1/START domain
VAARSDGLTLDMSRALPGAPSRVFEAFTDPTELARWWGPEGFSTPSLEFEPRVGESYRIEMQPPEGEVFYLSGEFRMVDPPARLAYTSDGRTPIPTTSRRSSTSPPRISASRRKSCSPRVCSRPRLAVRFTAMVGRTASTSWKRCCHRRPSSPVTAMLSLPPSVGRLSGNSANPWIAFEGGL